MNQSSKSARRTTQRTAALKPVNYVAPTTRKRAASATDQITTKKQKKTGTSKSSSGNNHPERAGREYIAPEILSDSDASQKNTSSLSTAGARSPPADTIRAPARGKNAQQVENKHTDSEDSHRDAESEDDEQDYVADLQKLDNDVLKSTFASERPQWKDHDANAVEKHQAQGLSPNESNDMGHIQPIVNQKQGHSVTHGRFNPRHVDIETDSPPRKSRTPVPKKTKASKREQDRRDEVPQWSNDVTVLTRPAARHQQKHKVIVLSESDGSLADSELDAAPEATQFADQSINKGWPTEAFYVQPKRGSRIISLKEQPAPLNKTLSRAIREATGDLLFCSAFPSIDENYKYHRKLLRSCARELKFDQLAERFSRDVDFGITMARLIQQRISNLRGVFKSKARSRVEGAFLLITNDPSTVLKVENLTQRTEYIFKPNNNGAGYDKLAPFRHPSIIAILQDVVFKGSRGSALSEKHAARFPTLPATSRFPKRRMLSEAMVCMAATAVHAVLDDWRSGREIPSDFNADLYQGVYDSHIEFMKYTHEGNPAGYQYMMSKIYEDCCVVTSGNIAVSNKAMELLDLHNMPVE